MKKTIIFFLTLVFSQNIFSQNNEYDKGLVELAKTYKNFHFRSDPPSNVYQEVNSISSEKLLKAKKFISEVVTSNNKLLTSEFLTKPDTITLKSLYIIRGVNWNMHEAEAEDNIIVVDSLKNEKTDYHELVSCYYGMLFSAIGNKNKPFDLSEVNFFLNNYNLSNDTEKGIFFLMSMRTFGTMIWGYINVPKPPNYKKALDYIKKYPRYNGIDYYRFTDLNFKDFKLTTDKRKPKESFKKYYINKYVETLMYHSLCLSQKKKHGKEKDNLLLESILRNDSYWQYTEYKPTLEKIFKKVKE
ncbi:hypothetical protein N1F78_01120 [Seonamhaeicola sp. MEBiC1930]|uniref:hypothetical protein n=1 Tax=Seonamhaeicola sp. MEBiC01930 TaxID=2976768 RepID=UPI00324FA794